MVKGSSVLFTRHAPWGMWTDVPGSHATRGTGYVSLCAKIPALWHQARMRFQDCEELMADLVLQGTVNQPARATKLGTKTWKDEGSLRVHLHAWVLFHGGHFMPQSLKPFKFRATRPHTSQYIIQSPKGRGHFDGAFYMSVDTAGMWEHHVRGSFCSLGCHGHMDHELVFGCKNHRGNSSAMVCPKCTRCEYQHSAFRLCGVRVASLP